MVLEVNLNNTENVRITWQRLGRRFCVSPGGGTWCFEGDIVKVAKTLRPEAFQLTSLTMGDLRWKENPFCCSEQSFKMDYWL